LSIVTGGVKTAGQTYFADLKLPEVSLYKRIENTVVSRAQGKDGMDRMEAMEYAEAVVERIEQRTGGKFWYGTNAELVRQATTAVAVPEGAFVSCCAEYVSSTVLNGTGCSDDHRNGSRHNEPVNW
jgi:1-acylglycerone phosphate reductase